MSYGYTPAVITSTESYDGIVLIQSPDNIWSIGHRINADGSVVESHDATPSSITLRPEPMTISAPPVLSGSNCASVFLGACIVDPLTTGSMACVGGAAFALPTVVDPSGATAALCVLGAAAGSLVNTLYKLANPSTTNYTTVFRDCIARCTSQPAALREQLLSPESESAER